MGTAFPDPFLEQSLSEEGIRNSVQMLLDPNIPDDPKGRFLTRLHRRGETAAELAGFARVLLRGAILPVINRANDAPLVELCGTGGDGAGLLNISTAAMFVAAGAGAKIVKHGNRAVTSRCGSADVLEALGVNLHVDPKRVGEVLERAGSVFMLAGDFHPAVAAVTGIRRNLAGKGQKTIFNLLGPLLNPAFPDCQLAGVYDGDKLELYAEAMGLLGRQAAWAVHGRGATGEEGFDEISVTGSSLGVRTGSGVLEHFTIDPFTLGFPRNPGAGALIGGNAVENARRIVGILSGEEHGAARDMIVINAAAAIHLAGFGTGLGAAVALSNESIDSGQALHSLNMLREASRSASA